ncbi:MAG TPA: serine hydrolase [Chthonomonadaceae bacterium]|nr:serine hydrolase [Chthonomonadaceae bacterium]
MGMEALRRRIAGIVGRVEGIMGVAVRDVETGEEIGIRADEPFPMASVCKTPILVEAYRRAESGTLSLDKRVEISRATRTFGSGLFNFFDEGLTPTVRDLILMMIVVSDNAATDLVLKELGGPAAVTEAMRQLGLPAIHLDRTIRQLLADIYAAIDSRTCDLDYFALEALRTEDSELAAKLRDPEAARAGIRAATQGRDTATPRDIARLYAQIARNECASPDSCAAILQTLERQQLKGRLPRELPPYTRFAHKTGSLGPGTVCNDSGLLFVGDHPIAIAVFSREVVQPPAATNTAIARIGRAVYEHFA